MAIDYGDARTGVALSDPTGFLAGQTFLIKSRKQEVVLEELAALLEPHFHGVEFRRVGRSSLLVWGIR